MMNSFVRHGPSSGAEPPPDIWGEALGEFLFGLLDGVDVDLHYGRLGDPPALDAGSQRSSARRAGPDDWSTVVSLRLTKQAELLYGPMSHGSMPDEFVGLPAAAVRALDRITATRQPGERPGERLYSTMRRALHDVVVAEILAEQIVEMLGRPAVIESVAHVMSDVLSYFGQLALSRVEGAPLTHGVVVATGDASLIGRGSGIRYPGPLPELKRTPLLFDGVRSVLVIEPDGEILGEATRATMGFRPELNKQRPFEEFLGDSGALVAASTRALEGIGFFLRADQTIWVFQQGSPFLIRRGGRWRAIPLNSLTAAIAGLVGSSEIGGLITRAAVAASLEGHGAILAVVDDASKVDHLIADRDRYDLAQRAVPRADDEPERVVHRLIRADPSNPRTLTRLSSIDGATVLDTSGRLIAYGAVVASPGSAGEGARTAAARGLSRDARVVLNVSEDGPITVFIDGEEVGAML